MQVVEYLLLVFPKLRCSNLDRLVGFENIVKGELFEVLLIIRFRFLFEVEDDSHYLTALTTCNRFIGEATVCSLFEFLLCFQKDMMIEEFELLIRSLVFASEKFFQLFEGYSPICMLEPLVFEIHIQEVGIARRQTCNVLQTIPQIVYMLRNEDVRFCIFAHFKFEVPEALLLVRFQTLEEGCSEQMVIVFGCHKDRR